MAIPDRVDRPVQVLDVRDLARLVVLLVERDLPGAFNAVGPSPSVSFLELVKICGGAELVPVPHGELDFPLLFPDPAWDVMLQISSAAALAAGMPQDPARPDGGRCPGLGPGPRRAAPHLRTL